MWLVIVLFIGYGSYQVKNFIADRPKTLYDIFEVSRLSTFEQIKDAKNDYLQNLRNKNNETWEGDKFALVNFTLSEQEVMDSYNVLTHFQLREMYDKHNVFYTEADFKLKGKSVSNLDKYSQVAKSIAGFVPFMGIIYMSFAENAIWGKRMAITLLFSFIYIVYQIKLPAHSATRENDAVQLFNKYCENEYLVKVFGPQLKHYTIHQVFNLVQKTLWQIFFQFCFAISKLLDVNIDQTVDKMVNGVGKKGIKSLQILELMDPQRSFKEQTSEFTDQVKTVAMRNRPEMFIEETKIQAENQI